MIVEAQASSAAGIVGAFGTWVLAFMSVLAVVVTAWKGPPIVRRQRQQSADLQEIHKLVDGNLTASMEATLDATRRELVTLREVARLHDEAGHIPNQDARAEIARTTLRVAELENLIVERRAVDVSAQTKEQP